ncbi:MAG: protease Lon-related BREX system protein BrxL [Christensenellales bacterium]|nr:protease Lon-related BREX system protein BrxL [Christensenellales bacterium]
MDALDRKINEVFPGKVVRKDLTALLRRGANVPTFVLEYLLGMYCATDDETAIAEGVEKIRKILAENYVRPEESEKVKSLIRERGEYTVIDKVSAVLDEYKDIYVARFSNLEIEPFVLQSDYAVKYTKILMGGIWCIARIGYTYQQDSMEDEKKRRKKRGPEDSPFRILGLKPIQLPNLDAAEMIDKRKEFTTEEWIAMLLRSEGMEPDALSEKEKLHFIERMVPLAEHNYNLCELGPRGTGKSHLYKEISPYSILMSGGQTTTANLFYSMSAHRVGLVGHWDCVAFDEVAGMRFRDLDAIQIMKDYMASGSFARGRDMINADASMVFVGNINDSVQNLLKVAHLFEPFPPEFNNDSAFFDRIHYYLPGWEIPKMRSELLTEKYGLITDCLAELTRELRKKDCTHLLDAYFRLNNKFNKRDEIAVRKTMSGLIKLIFPDENVTEDEMRRLLEYAIEGRRRVKEQLKLMAGVEFADVALGYVDEYGSETVVSVPEQASNTLIPAEKLPAGHVFALGANQIDGEVAVYRLENKVIRGNGKMETQGIGGNRAVNECVDAAWYYFMDKARSILPGTTLSDHDYLLYYADPQSKGLSTEVSVAELVGLCSAVANRPVMEATAVIGEIKLSGTMGEIKNLENIVRVAKNAGAKQLLLPIQSMQELMHVPGELLTAVQPIFYSDPIEAVKKAIELA